MDTLKQRILLTVAGCIAVLVAGWFLLVSPQHARAAELREQAAVQRATSDGLRTSLQVLKAQAKDVPHQQARIATVAAKIPAHAALPALVRAVNATAADAGVEVVSIAPGPAAGAAAAGAPAGAPPAGGLVTIPLSIEVVGGYFDVQQFVRGLETTSRALRLTSLSLAPGASPVVPGGSGATPQDGSVLRATLTGQAFTTADGAPTSTPPAATAPAAGGPAPAAPTVSSN